MIYHHWCVMTTSESNGRDAPRKQTQSHLHEEWPDISLEEAERRAMEHATRTREMHRRDPEFAYKAEIVLIESKRRIEWKPGKDAGFTCEATDRELVPA